MKRSESSGSEEPPGTERMISISGRISCPTCGGVGTVLTWTMPKSMGNGSPERKTWLWWTGLLLLYVGACLTGSMVGLVLLATAITSAMTMRFVLSLVGAGIGFGLLGSGVIILEG